MTIECSYRRPVQPSGQVAASGAGERDLAVCGLLAELSGVEDARLCRVSLDACRSCCGWFRPTPQNINPVVASLLYNLSSAILDQGGVAGCSRDQAAQLNRRASADIPPESDAASGDSHSCAQANLDCADLESLVPRPKRRAGPRVAQWAVGVTTAPREQPTLEDCLSSIAAAGWGQPRLFVDGDADLGSLAGALPATRRRPRIGAWPSYYLALAEMMLRSPSADAFLMVQDDVVLFRHASLRSYLETILWPGSRPGLVSLFCSRAYTQPQPGWRQLKQALVWGGQAIIFSREAALSFLSDSQVVRHRFLPGAAGLANIDWLIGQWAKRAGIPVHLPTPSLAQHVGHVSALWPNVRAFGNRRADRFAGDGRKDEG